MKERVYFISIAFCRGFEVILGLKIWIIISGAGQVTITKEV